MQYLYGKWWKVGEKVQKMGKNGVKVGGSDTKLGEIVGYLGRYKKQITLKITQNHT
jgi:hypothetical protein